MRNHFTTFESISACFLVFLPIRYLALLTAIPDITASGAFQEFLFFYQLFTLVARKSDQVDG